MRSARLLLATAAASATLALAATGAHATGDEAEPDGSSYSQNQDDTSSEKKDDDTSASKDEDTSGSKDEDSDKKDDNDHGKKDDNDHGYGKKDHDDHDKKDDGDKHDKPDGGVHTGGGALALLNDDYSTPDPKHDPETYKNKDDEQSKGSWSKDEDKEKGSWSKDEDKEKDSWNKDEEDKDSYGGGHDKPNGGVHTGGGALAGADVTAGGLAVLALAGTGLYAARRRKTTGGLA
ncbi:hypothetical protein [Streptomyces sp. NPDC059894]|uniref:hypothetical protein n=1 Tax=Streptomyces sp. NPDC059894 TaxID=3346991 RepID=UPI003655EEE2